MISRAPEYIKNVSEQTIMFIAKAFVIIWCNLLFFLIVKMLSFQSHNHDITQIGPSQAPTATPLRHLSFLGENFLVNNCGIYDLFRKLLKCMHKSIFRTNHIYHNCLLESSHLENPSVLMGWWSGIGMTSHFQNESYIYKSP